MKRIPIITAFLALAALFSFVFMQNPFQVGDPYEAQHWKPRVFETFQTDTYDAIKQTMELTRRDGHWPGGGFIYGYPHKTDVYDRAFALHVKLYSSLFSLSKADVESYMNGIECGVSIFFGAMLAAFVLYVRRLFGWGAAIALTVLSCLSDWLVFVGRNIDLLFFLRLLLPILSFMLFRYVVDEARLKFRHFLLILWAVMLVLCLCTNLFITNVVLGVGIGPVFWGLLRRKPIKQIAGWVVTASAVAASAVVISLVATAIQGYLYFGSLERASTVFHAIYNRMYGHEAQFLDVKMSDWSAPAEVSIFQIFEQYLTIPMMSLPFYQNRFPGYHIYLSFYAFFVAIVPFSLLSLLDGKRFPRFESNRSLLMSLSGATIYGLAASLSWAFLMKGHMWHHTQQAALIFYLPYMLFLYILMGLGITLVLLQLFDFTRARKWPSLHGISTEAGVNAETKAKPEPPASRKR